MNKAVGFTIILAALALAGVFLLRNRGGPPLPDSREYATEWICERCGQVTELTPLKLAEWMRAPGRARRGSDGDLKQSVFLCDACQTFTVVRARRCERHNTLFPAVHADGAIGYCPQCGPPRDPAPPGE